MKVQENSSDGRGDAAEKLFCSPSKVPFIINWLQPNWHHLQSIKVIVTYEVPEKSIQPKPRYSRRVLSTTRKVLLITDQSQLYIHRF